MFKFNKTKILIILALISIDLGIGIYKGKIDPNQFNNSLNNATNIIEEINNMNR